MVPAFLDLELVLVFLALGQVQYLDPWPQLKQPNMGRPGPLEGLEILAEPVSQVVWQESDLLLPKPLPKLPSLASGESEDWELGALELFQGLEPLEVCPRLPLLKQPNMVPLASEVS